MHYITDLKNFFARTIFRLYHYILLPLRYKIRVIGLENLDTKQTLPGGMLFLSNHPTHLDASIVGTALVKRGRQVSIWSMDFVYKNAYARMCARQRDTLCLLKVPNVHEHRSIKNPQKVRKLIRRTVEGLQEGENVLFFPAGYQKFTAKEEINGKSAVYRILSQNPDVNIVLVRIVGMWGSRFSKAVKKSERSNVRRGNWFAFVWNIFKMVALNLVFFIPKRKVTLEFFIPTDFPRKGTRQQMNQYLENFYNKGFVNGEEPLQRVPDFFWKAQYTANEYHLKCYNFDLHLASENVKKDVFEIVARKAGVPVNSLRANMLLDRDLSLDSLEITEIFIELESKYKVPELVPKNVTSVGHLIALTAGIPIEYVPVYGEFPVIKEEPTPVFQAWQVCTALFASFFSFLDTQK